MGRPAEELAAIEIIRSGVAICKTDLLGRKKFAFCRTGFLLGYNGNPIAIPHWTIGILVCEQSLRKYLGTVSGFFREQVVAGCYASRIRKMFMQMIYKFCDTVVERR